MTDTDITPDELRALASMFEADCAGTVDYEKAPKVIAAAALRAYAAIKSAQQGVAAITCNRD